jgi:predicted DNA-binding transcriptional regulator AlpA
VDISTEPLQLMKIQVDEDYVLRAGDVLEFLSPRGAKKAGGWAKSPEEFCGFFGISAETLNLWIAQGLRAVPTADGSLRITETAYDDWERSKFGRTVPEPSPYLNIEQVAARIQRSVRGVRGLIYRGRFPEPLPGSRILLWTPQSIDRWLENRRGKGKGKRTAK